MQLSNLTKEERREKAMALVDAERDRQMAKWGDQSSNPRWLWYAILGEEFGEVGTALMDIVVTQVEPEYVIEGREELRDEIVQVAAVAVAWLEALEKEEGVSLDA